MKIGLIANCQATPLAKFFADMVPGAVVNHIIVHTAKESDAEAFLHDAIDADVVISYLVKKAPNAPSLVSEHARAALGSKFKLATNLYFSGYHPDFQYLYVGDRRLKGFLGEYHSRICTAGALLGIERSVVLEFMTNAEFGRVVGYGDVFQNSIADLVERDAILDLKYGKRFSSIADQRVSFYTFNHPTNELLADYANFVLGALGIPHRQLAACEYKEFLSAPGMLCVHPSVVDYLKSPPTGILHGTIKRPGSRFLEPISSLVDGTYSLVDRMNPSMREVLMEQRWFAAYRRAMANYI